MHIVGALVAGALTAGLGIASQAVGQARAAVAPDPVAALAARLAPASPLTGDAAKAYLSQVLRELQVPEESQVLVFSKTSLQFNYITPQTPRAIYFNDTVAVGTVPGAPFLEFTALGDDGRTRFYNMRIDGAEPGRIKQDENNCNACHTGVYPELVAPTLLIGNTLTLDTGQIAFAPWNSLTDGRTQIKDRWGGWYVTGRHGSMKHRGNVMAKYDKNPTLDPVAGLNVADLSGRLDTSRYLRPTSDIVALMTLEHQVGFANLTAKLSAQVLARKDPPEITATIEELADYMLGVGQATLTAPVSGTSGFTEQFARQGPRDSAGRSLREFDLRSRIFRYPLSYMIYTPTFDAIAPELKARVYARLLQVLSGQDRSPKYAKLSGEDRRAAMEILAQTKPGVPSDWKTARVAAN